MTQLEKARGNEVTEQMRFVSGIENADPELVIKEIAAGRAVIPANILHRNLKPIIIGEKFSTKINANIGSSPDRASIGEELEKLNVAVRHGSDAVMDLSTGGNIDEIRREILKNSEVPIGTVPIYQAIVEGKEIEDLTEKDFLDSIEKHIKDGVDFVTVHAGVQRKEIPLLKKRLTGVVSRGGSILVMWMKHNNAENPLYENFDRILEMAYKYDVTLSLGDALRPGSIADETDAAQISELKNLGELTKIAWKEDVQVMIEGPGHIPLHKIKENVEMQKKYCHNAPFYVLGPLVTDVAPGYDHITSAIGGAVAGMHGVSFICYVTPAEHLRLPSVDDVREGVIAAKIAAHAADIARGIDGAAAMDREMSRARKELDWEKQFCLALDGEKARKYRKQSNIKEDVCTMCGKFCAIKVYDEKD